MLDAKFLNHKSRTEGYSDCAPFLSLRSRLLFMTLASSRQIMSGDGSCTFQLMGPEKMANFMKGKSVFEPLMREINREEKKKPNN